MAKQNQIFGSDMTKFSFTTRVKHGIRWTVENVSKMHSGTKVFSPDFYLAPGCMGCISLSETLHYLLVLISYESSTEINIARKLVLYDCNNMKLYEERDENIFSLKKHADQVVLGRVQNKSRFHTLTNDTLVIDLCVSIKKNATKKLNRLICDTDPERNLREDLKTMLENPVNSDVFLQVGDERIPAHWSVLCSRSPYFKKMFDSRMQERVQNSVIITDSSLGTVKKLIQFLYTAVFVQGDDLQELFDLYYAADKYEVMDLRTLCGRKIVSNATSDNACEILQLSHRYNDKALKSEAIDFIRSHSDAVFQTEGWKKFELSEPVTAEFISFCLKKN